MTDITFTPAFKHITWVDNRDRVAAGGPNGFNIRFDTLQKDLEALSGVVKKIDTAIKATGQQPSVQRKLTVTPAFAPVTPNPGWNVDSFGVAVRPESQASVSGIVTVNPPDGVLLTKFRAAGGNSGTGTLRVGLFRAPVTSTSSSDLLARVTGAGSYDDSPDIAQATGRVDMNAFRYFVIANLSGAAGTDTVTVTTIQISYTIG
ncbi:MULTISPECIES: hypothetical protein [unclassified Streptomyces]|uniref:hypothetical protein n=1 Tax=unclassified Streptomyces TaxID=2593676 RepID=UPI0016609468|nr:MULTISPECIES: hypothetical protein [unclassified Streptomyces]MBD0708184.1 hypothetical protein [Streptomyces sp. CBMA291]MBD0714506.1 hypothetical protein [Streptomyces sp. CBMA370]